MHAHSLTNKRLSASPRAVAAKVLTDVVENGRSLDRTLAKKLTAMHDSAARALTQELCYGVLRWYFRLEAVARPLLRAPVKDRDIYYLLLIGLYQIIYLRVASHAAVDETVAACEALGKPWIKGFINGVLRAYLRKGAASLTELDASDVARYAHPAWLIDAIKADWPEQWQAILDANNQHPPLSLRVNTRHISRDDYLARLGEAGIEAIALRTPQAIALKKPVPVEKLPGFADGWVSVQDEVAQLAAALLNPQPGERILDACAAPGGKACHILEAQDVELVALDCDEQRLTRVRENLDRLRLSAELVYGDAATPDGWWDGRAFDRILLDTPCSGTGVIRRHPDIKLLRHSSDIEALAERQAQLLAALWPLLKPGGMLLYATCSVLTQENERQMGTFLDRHPDAHAEPLVLSQLCAATVIGQQILPGEHGMDGFYYARLRKH